MHTLLDKTQIFQKFQKAGKENKNICYIFGAGASKGYTKSRGTSGAIYSNKNISSKSSKKHSNPPTVNELLKPSKSLIVDKVLEMDKHEYINNQRDFLIEELKNYEGGLEEYLAKTYAQDNNDYTFSLLLEYLNDIFHKASRKNFSTRKNNYKTLTLKSHSLFGREGWSCISFNYDTIFEQSFMATGKDLDRSFDTMNDYLDTDPKLIKIHGSINFRYLFQELPPSKKNYKNIFDLMMNKGKISQKNKLSRVKVIKPSFISQTFKNDTKIKIPNKPTRKQAFIYNIPLMMIPIHGTKKIESKFFKRFFHDAKEEIKNSDIVVTIGYNFGDELFSQALKNIDLENVELIMVGTDSIYKKPKKHTGVQNASKIWNNFKIFEGSGFNDFTEAIMTK